MVYGFDKETSALNGTELKVVKLIIPHLKNKIGEGNAVTSKKMIDGIKRVHGIALNGSRLRKVINHIRINNLIPRLVATSKGYYVENNAVELKKYIDSLEQRAGAIIAVAKALKGQI